MTGLSSMDLAQRKAALVSAQDRRLRRVELKASVKRAGRDGGRDLARVLLHEHELIDNMDIGEYLMWMPGWGKKTIRYLLKDRPFRIDPWHAIGDLTERQRAGLALALEEAADGIQPYRMSHRKVG